MGPNIVRIVGRHLHIIMTNKRADLHSLVRGHLLQLYGERRTLWQTTINGLDSRAHLVLTRI